MAGPDDDPIAVFRRWQRAAAGEVSEVDSAGARLAIRMAAPLRRSFAWLVGGGELPRADAAALATVTPEGQPAVRMVLVKQASAQGFEFFTNYGSPKARDLDASPFAALLFHWPLPPRQVRVEGPVQRTSAEVSDAYWRSRPRGSQLASAASRQSEPITSRGVLLERVSELQRRYRGMAVPRPDGWGGYRLRPERVELWEARPSRLHERIRYDRLRDGGWDGVPLQP